MLGSGALLCMRPLPGHVHPGGTHDENPGPYALGVAGATGPAGPSSGGSYGLISCAFGVPITLSKYPALHPCGAPITL